MPLFLLFAAVAGFAWEMLFRGFLINFLPSLVGVPGVDCVAALSYAAGRNSRRWSAHGSCVSALRFKIGYAVTSNLWWLVVLHVGLSLLALLAHPGGSERVL